MGLHVFHTISFTANLLYRLIASKVHWTDSEFA